MTFHRLFSAFALCALGCNASPSRTEARPPPTTTTPTASTPTASATAAVPYGTLEGKASLEPGDEIDLCWRIAPSSNPFAANAAPYTCGAKMKAIAAPWDAEEGGLNEATVSRTLDRALGPRAKRREMTYVSSVAAAADPSAPSSGISLGDDSEGYLNDYVVVDDAGRRWVFVQVQVAN